jgi:monoamine oxidase
MDQAFRPNRRLARQAFHRRGFLKGAAAAALSPIVAPRHAQAAAAAARKSETILVVGAGLAGLVAAYRLREAGKRVVVIEARAQPGGRVRTLRGHFDDGLYGELGAARVAETHEYVLHWLNDLKLGLVPFAPASGSAILAVNGMRAPADDEAARERLFPGLAPDERKLSPSGLLLKYVQGVPEELANPDIDLSNPRWRQFDRINWPAWLASRGASKAAIQLMTLGGDSSPFSALFMLQQIMLHRDSRQYHKIQGGMDSLPRAIAARLGGVIRYNCELVRLERSAAGVRASCRQDGRLEIIAADRAVLALPFSTLRCVAIDPPFSPAKSRIIAELSYYEATRFLLQTRSRFWQTAHLTGGARTDGPADIWDMSFGQKGTRGLLSATTGNAQTEKTLAAMNEAARVAYGTALLKPAFPELPQQLQKSFVQRWVDEPYARGAFTVFRPGQMTQWGAAIGRPEPQVHFAGEHTSAWNGWMEGALWSGEHVAQEILQQ